MKMGVVVTKSVEINEWQISNDKTTLTHNSGYSLVKKYNESEGSMVWNQFPEVNNELMRQGLRFLYHTEGLALIHAYINKYSFSVDQMLDLVNKEFSTYDFPKEAMQETDKNLDAVHEVLNEYKPRHLKKEELELVIDGEEYCEPWISGMIRSAVYKWNRNML